MQTLFLSLLFSCVATSLNAMSIEKFELSSSGDTVTLSQIFKDVPTSSHKEINNFLTIALKHASKYNTVVEVSKKSRQMTIKVMPKSDAGRDLLAAMAMAGLKLKDVGVESRKETLREKFAW